MDVNHKYVVWALRDKTIKRKGQLKCKVRDDFYEKYKEVREKTIPR